jgi:hypothetical protein
VRVCSRVWVGLKGYKSICIHIEFYFSTCNTIPGLNEYISIFQAANRSNGEMANQITASPSAYHSECDAAQPCSVGTSKVVQNAPYIVRRSENEVTLRIIS